MCYIQAPKVSRPMIQGAVDPLRVVAGAPMLRLALPLMLGMVLAMRWSLPLAPALAVLALLSVVAFAVFARRLPFATRGVRGAVSMAWFLVFGICWQELRDPLTQPTHVAVDGVDRLPRVLRVTAVNGISDKVVRADADVLAMLRDGVVHTRTGAVMLTLLRKPGEADPVAGDELMLRSVVLPITRVADPGGFDRGAWAASRGLHHETFAGSGDWRIIGHGWQWTDLFEPTRQRIATWLVESGLSYRERALAKALVLGLRDELDHEQKDAFVKSGTVHILAVSGSHVGFIYAMLLFLLDWWGGGTRARVTRGGLILLALWGYAGLTGACPSVLRATIMFSLFTLASMTERRNEALNSLFAAALVLVLWDPHMLVEVGFLLSFLAVLGIILFYGPLLRLWMPGGRALAYCWSLVVVSLAAQVFTTPLSLYLFQAFPVWFLPANLVVVFVAGMAVWGSVALLAFFRIPLLGGLISFLLSLLLVVVDRVTTFFAELPGAYPAIRVTWWDMLLLYAMVVLLAIWSFWRWRPALGASGIALVMLLLGWGVQARQQQDRVTFTVYDDRKALQVSMVVGRELTVFTPDTSHLPPWLQQKVGRHIRARGVVRQGSIGPDELYGHVASTFGQTYCGGGSWSAPGIKVHFHHGGSEVVVRHAADVLVLHDLAYLGAADLEELAVGPGHVVLAGGLPWKLRRFVQRWCAERNIHCHDVRDQGAFIAERRVGS